MSPENATPHPPICDYEGSDYQTAFWDEGNRSYEDQVEAVALRQLLPPEGKLLLEVGAGAGRNTPRYRGFKSIVLLDYSRTQLQQARERLGPSGRYLFVAADAYHLPFVPGLFDAATMIRTLHHMVDTPRALRQVRQTLREEGVFILEFANKQNLKAITRYIFRRQSWSPFSLAPVEFAPLNFDFHPKSVRAWLRAAGFRVEEQVTVSHFRAAFLKQILPLRLLVSLDTLAQKTGNWWQLTPSVFVRARTVGSSQIPTEGTFFSCPKCGQALKHLPALSGWQKSPSPADSAEEWILSCPGCDRDWTFRDGIYDFREPI